ncbi:MAG: hypothetical protein CVV27_09875 [Candidatus Melainabacteria bacterium HGW-Melainabacteria-1]|nr:MAG: hypothetical protein CVV27_09875 [Candidatus Melainabacteria bacterium HGW-Melainabacteria-1]
MVQKQRISRRARAQAALDTLLAESPQLDPVALRQFEALALLLARRYEGAELARQLGRLVEAHAVEGMIPGTEFGDTAWMSLAQRRRYQAEIQRLLNMPPAAREDYLSSQESWKGPLGLFYDTPETRQAFQMLGIEPPGSPDQIRQAYRIKARSMHPDLGGANEAFIRLQRAYRTALESCL